MKAGVVCCCCCRCFSFPSKRRTRRRPGVLPLRSVPEDAVLGVVEGLPAEELLWLGAVRSRLKYLVDGHAAVWAWARFEDVWPAAKPLEVLASSPPGISITNFSRSSSSEASAFPASVRLSCCVSSAACEHWNGGLETSGCASRKQFQTWGKQGREQLVCDVSSWRCAFSKPAVR
ncbi:cyclin-F-like isoform X1 [Gallus gallus]|uniref:F-box domain-containing protein n=2 Tax=Gallus gallus TaxID=9031 RepID=A0A8V0Z7S5_CHICK|nr:cyclin-F-like isoform X1 [Gallus gallus]